MKSINDIKAIEGAMVLKARLDSGSLLLSFSDGRALEIKIGEPEYDGHCQLELCSQEIMHPNDLFRLGIITKTQRIRLNNEIKRMAEARQLNRNQKEYRRLQKIFDPKEAKEEEVAEDPLVEVIDNIDEFDKEMRGNSS